MIFINLKNLCLGQNTQKRQILNVLWKELDVPHLLKEQISANPHKYINPSHFKLLYGRCLAVFR